MKKLFLLLSFLEMCSRPALAQQATVYSPPKEKIQWQSLSAGWDYQNKFTNELTSSYFINWNVTGTFSYQKWNLRANYCVPTFKYSFKQPFYLLQLEYKIAQRKP